MKVSCSYTPKQLGERLLKLLKNFPELQRDKALLACISAQPDVVDVYRFLTETAADLILTVRHE